jgi:hypothetical protein
LAARQACELEHGLMCEYLFAQFTLKRTQQEGLSVQQLTKVAAWERVIVDVTKQEMLHLALATTAKHLMNWVMRPLGSLLTTLPVGPDRPGVLAGPAFEIVQPSFYVLPAAWRILTERLEQLPARADRLSGTAGLAQIGELAIDLYGMARDIESA